jgi:hypothetical protein
VCTRAGECDGLLIGLALVALGVLVAVAVITTLWGLAIAAVLRRRGWSRRSRSMLAGIAVIGSIVAMWGLLDQWPVVGGPIVAAVALGAGPVWLWQRRRAALATAGRETV